LREVGSLMREAGPYFAYRLLQKNVYKRSGKKEKPTKNPDELDENVRYIDWGGTIGAGFLVPVLKGELDFNIKFEHSIQSFLTRDNPALYYGNYKAYYEVLAFTVGYSLPVMNRTLH
jgi:hypothetical protein